jgi:hypothetical protein
LALLTDLTLILLLFHHRLIQINERVVQSRPTGRCLGMSTTGVMDVLQFGTKDHLSTQKQIKILYYLDRYPHRMVSSFKKIHKVDVSQLSYEDMPYRAIYHRSHPTTNLSTLRFNIIKMK